MRAPDHVERIEGFESAELAPSAQDVHSGVKGKSKSKKNKLREAAAALSVKRKP